jgi:hypothetical protein
MGYLYSADLDRLQLNWFKEAARQKGTQVFFFETLTENKNIYTDIEVQSLSNALPVDIIFEQYPQNRKTLQKAGWYNKDSDDNPDTAYVPLDLTILKRWQNVLIPFKISATLFPNPSTPEEDPDMVKYQKRGWRKYQITKMSTVMDYPHYYLVALAPVFTDNSPEIDRTKNSTFIDFDEIEAGEDA